MILECHHKLNSKAIEIFKHKRLLKQNRIDAKIQKQQVPATVAESASIIQSQSSPKPTISQWVQSSLKRPKKNPKSGMYKSKSPQKNEQIIHTINLDASPNGRLSVADLVVSNLSHPHQSVNQTNLDFYQGQPNYSYNKSPPNQRTPPTNFCSPSDKRSTSINLCMELDFNKSNFKDKDI